MQINGVILANQLSRYFEVASSQCSERYPVNKALFYNEFFEMENCAIVVESGDLNRPLKGIRHCVIIYLDAPASPLSSDHNDIIILNDPISHKIIFNILATIFELFDTWGDAMRRIFYDSMDFHALLEATQMVHPTPICLMDKNFKYVAYTDSSLALTQYIDETNSLPMSESTALTTNPDYKKTETIRGAFLYTSDVSVVYCNIFDNDMYVGRLVALVPDEALNEVDYYKAIFNLLSPFVENIYAKSHNFDTASPQRIMLREILKGFRDGKPINLEQLTRLLGNNGFGPDDSYQTVCFLPNISERVAYNLSYLGNQAERIWPGTCCVCYDDRLLMLIDQTRFQAEGPGDFRQELACFLRDNLLLAGISRCFTNLNHLSLLKAGWEQAEYAARKGRELHPTKWSHSFDDFALICILEQGIHCYSPELIAHPGILVLKRHDARHGTAYYPTLLAYIQNGFNASAAAKALYIHRNSFTGRMTRIMELCPLHLDDLDERLYLLLSIKLLEESDPMTL